MKTLVSTIELPPLKDDYAFHPTLVPGNAQYERLLVSDPKKLQRMRDEEQFFAETMNTPEALVEARAIHVHAQDEVRHDFAIGGKWSQRYTEARRTWRDLQPTLQDRALLGLETNASLTKRDVRNAYRRKARKAHPDVGGNADDFKRLYAAYRTVLLCAK